MDSVACTKIIKDGLLEIANDVREIFLRKPNQDNADTARGAILKRLDGGDPHYLIDELAENAVTTFLKKWELPVAWFSEDRGLDSNGDNPAWILIIDPIDGTRSAISNFESCCFSAAVAKYSQDPKFSDITFALVMELKSGNYYYAEKDEVGIFSSVAQVPCLTKKTDPQKMFWSTELTAHPIRQIARVCGRLIDESVTLGAVFVFTSSSYSLTRIVTGQLDAHVDVGHRILKDNIESNPEIAEEFRKVGRGEFVTLFPYDIAAAAFILINAGGTVTDAYGNPLNDLRLTTDKSINGQCSIIAASNWDLYNKIIKKLEW